MIAHAASINGRTADGRKLCERSLAAEAVDVIRFQRSVGREIESVRRGNSSDGTGLLIALLHDIDPAEIALGAEDTAFVPVISSQNPEAVSPGIVNDVMDVANGASGKCVRDVPRCTTIGGAIDVDFVSRGVVKILSPVDGPAGNGSDVQRTRAAGDGISLAEFQFAWTQCDDRSRNGADESSRWQNSKRVETITKKASGDATGNGKPSPQLRLELRQVRPGDLPRIFKLGANNFISARCVELVSCPGECSQAGEAGGESQCRVRNIHSRMKQSQWRCRGASEIR